MWHLPLIEIHGISAYSFLEAVEIPLNGGIHQIISSIKGSFQFCVVQNMQITYTGSEVFFNAIEKLNIRLSSRVPEYSSLSCPKPG